MYTNPEIQVYLTGDFERQCQFIMELKKNFPAPTDENYIKGTPLWIRHNDEEKFLILPVIDLSHALMQECIDLIEDQDIYAVVCFDKNPQNIKLHKINMDVLIEKSNKFRIFIHYDSLDMTPIECIRNIARHLKKQEKAKMSMQFFDNGAPNTLFTNIDACRLISKKIAASVWMPDPNNFFRHTEPDGIKCPSDDVNLEMNSL